MGAIRVPLRLRFVKLPDTSDERIFRDVLRLASDPEDRVLDALLDIVDKKLSFMAIVASGADVTLFYREDNGDRVVIDAPYYEQLTRKWAKAAELARRRHAKMDRQVVKRARSDVATPPVLAGTASACSSSEAADDSGSEQHDGSDNASTESSLSHAPEQVETVEVEVQMRVMVSAHAGETHRLEPLVATPSISRKAALPRPAGPRLANAPVVARGIPDGPPAMPLTAANLAKVAAVPTVSPLNALVADRAAAHTAATAPNGPQLLLLNELTCPPVNPHFYLRCVVLSIRVKLPRADMSVTEMELCDAADPSQRITAVSFDEVVQRGIRESLRGDRRQVVELRNVTPRRKSDLDRRYEANVHPLQLRLERQCQIEVVQILPIPVGAAPRTGESSHPVVTVRASLPAAGVLDVAAMVAAAPTGLSRPGSNVPTALSDVRGAGVGASSSSSSLSGGPRRTTFSFSSGGGSSGHEGVSGGANGAVTSTALFPSALGQQARAQQMEFLNSAAGGRAVDAIHQREALLQHHANKELERKERLRRRAPVSQRCILCELNLDDEEDTMGRVRRLLEASTRNRGHDVPTIDALRTALSDPRQRRTTQGSVPSRVVCKSHFVNAASRTVQVVHPRCAHLCTAYQRGDSLEDIALYQCEMQVCSLCGMPGATVSCYHPDCREMYHTVCALFSNGYVNFGKRDPYLPCPACPRHTQVVIDANGNASSPRSGHEYVVQGNDPSCWEDGIVFDSRVVEETDLRDPDENGGA